MVITECQQSFIFANIMNVSHIFPVGAKYDIKSNNAPACAIHSAPVSLPSCADCTLYLYSSEQYTVQ